MNGGRNSNRADDQGESWVDILSAATPSLSSPWISCTSQKLSLDMRDIMFTSIKPLPLTEHRLQECSLWSLPEWGWLHDSCLVPVNSIAIELVNCKIHDCIIFHINETLSCSCLNCITDLFRNVKNGELGWCNLLSQYHLRERIKCKWESRHTGTQKDQLATLRNGIKNNQPCLDETGGYTQVQHESASDPWDGWNNSTANRKTKCKLVSES